MTSSRQTGTRTDDYFAEVTRGLEVGEGFTCLVESKDPVDHTSNAGWRYEAVEIVEHGSAADIDADHAFRADKHGHDL
jgi:hypothetical protein